MSSATTQNNIDTICVKVADTPLIGYVYTLFFARVAFLSLSLDVATAGLPAFGVVPG